MTVALRFTLAVALVAGAGCGVPRAKYQSTLDRARRAEASLKRAGDARRREIEALRTAQGELARTAKSLAASRRELSRARSELRRARRQLRRARRPARRCKAPPKSGPPAWVKKALLALTARAKRAAIHNPRPLSWYLHPRGVVLLVAGTAGGRMVISALHRSPAGALSRPLRLARVVEKGAKLRGSRDDVIHRGRLLGFRVDRSYFKGGVDVRRSSWYFLRVGRRLSAACTVAGTSIRQSCSMGPGGLACSSWHKDAVQLSWRSGKGDRLEVLRREYASRRRRGHSHRHVVTFPRRGRCKKTKPQLVQ